MLVYNPSDPDHGSKGYGHSPDLTKVINGKDIDRSMALQVPREDVAYVNGSTPRVIKLKFKIKSKGQFRVKLDKLVFLGTTTDVSTVSPRAATHQYFSPGVAEVGSSLDGDPDLTTLPPNTSYVLRIYNVHPGILNVNWAFGALTDPTHDSDDDDELAIRVYRGLVTDSNNILIPPGRAGENPEGPKNDLVGRAHIHPHHGETYVRTGFIEVDEGLYTIVFSNEGDDDEVGLNSTAEANRFAASGIVTDSWIYAPAYRDYQVRSNLGDIGLKAVVRQVPGALEPSPFPWSSESISWVKNLVYIESYREPLGLADVLVDKDNDYIFDTVDGGWVNGAFIDESAVKSKRFTDQDRGGTTYGLIVNSAGLIVNVQDLNNPAEGVLISVTGRGDNRAELNVCDTALFLTNGDAVKATCGSLILDVIQGPVEIPLFDGLVVETPSKASTEVEKVTSKKFTVRTLKKKGPKDVKITNKAEINYTLAEGAEVAVEKGVALATPTPTPEVPATAIPTPTASPTAVPTPAVTPVLAANAVLATATPTPAPTATPTSTPTPAPTATPTPTPTPASTATPTPTPTPAPTATPTPTPTPAPTATPTPTPTPAPGETTIASDGFENGGLDGGAGWADNWVTAAINVTRVTSQDGPNTGAFHARLLKDSGSAVRQIDLTGRSGVHLKFWAKVDGFEGPDTATVEVSTNGGSTFSTVQTFTTSDSDAVYRSYDIDLSGFSMTSDFQIAFRTAAAAKKSKLLIDDVELVE